MHFILDIHCHTINSNHAYSTITENAAHAASIGLTHIGIADHGPGMPGGAHKYHFYNLGALPKHIHGVRVLRGIEANILNRDGELDFPNDILSRLDFVIASMHREVILTSGVEANTATLVNAMQNPNVHIIGHPNNIVYPINIEEVVRAAADTHTILEVNNHSLIPGSFRYNGEDEFVQMLELCKKYRVQVLASSDAHYHEAVGDFSYAKQLIESAGLPNDLVINTSAERLADAVKKKSTINKQSQV